MMRVLHGISMSLLSMSMMLKVLLGLLVHGLAIYIAWDLSGFLAAFLTLIFPVIGEVYWIYQLWSHTGHFWSILAIGCAAYIGVWVALSVFVGIAAATEPNRR
jgi:hypothetical protein